MPVGTHVFVDETENRGYLVAAAVILPPHVTVARRTVDSLCRSGQRRVHVTGENNARRWPISAAMTGPRARGDRRRLRPPSSGSPHTLPGCHHRGLAGGWQGHLVLERDDSVLNHDKRGRASVCANSVLPNWSTCSYAPTRSACWTSPLPSPCSGPKEAPGAQPWNLRLTSPTGSETPNTRKAAHQPSGWLPPSLHRS